MTKPEEQLKQLVAGATRVISEEELLGKLRERRPLRVKLGFDPSSPDIHLGHTVVLRKIRQFQDLGHTAVIIIGDYTALIGDPTGRSKTRPALSPEEIAGNARTYQDQIFKIIDPARTEVRRNSEWLGKMTYADVLRLNGKMNVARMLERDDFKKRFDEGVGITLTEFQYPLMQGQDSVEVRADVELGGNDQLFNNLVGRDLQRDAGQASQVVMVMPILEGLDGVQKMSKSLGNYIGVTDSPREMFGKVMSISDELMARWYPLLAGTGVDARLHPLEAKKKLGEILVDRFHGLAAAQDARADFETRFSKKDLAGADLPCFEPGPGEAPLLDLAEKIFHQVFNLKRSRSEIRKLIQQGAVQLDGCKLPDANASLKAGDGQVLRLDKTRAVRLKIP